MTLGLEGEAEARKLLGIPIERAKELKSLYDWAGLKEVIKRCPVSKGGKFELLDCYNLIDLHA